MGILVASSCSKLDLKIVYFIILNTQWGIIYFYIINNMQGIICDFVFNSMVRVVVVR